MSALYLSTATEAGQSVRLPRPADAIGAALRGVFHTPVLPKDMARLLHCLDRNR